MARYEHLRLVRLPERLPRRKTGGGGPPPTRNAGGHSRKLQNDLDTTIANQQQRRRDDIIDPTLILRVQMVGPLLEDEWNKVGLTLLSSDEDKSLVLFSSTDDLAEFRRKIQAFGAGIPAGQRNPSYASFIANIDSIEDVSPADRIGSRLREAGFREAGDFVSGTDYVLDIELWEIGRRDVRERKVDEIVRFAEALGAEELDRHIGPSLTLVRIRCDGNVVRNLLQVEEISEIDLPPQPDLQTAELMDLALGDLPEITPVSDDAPLIGIIDSGINDHPLLEDIIVGNIAIPESLGTADDHGHGTFVGGIATFGNLRDCLSEGDLSRGCRLCSAKVVDQNGRFPNSRLTPKLMREAISRLNAEFGCRIFVIALGDRTKVVEGGKVGPWAQALDELVRELDVVIIVAAGNRQPRRGAQVEQTVTDYPGYLFEDGNRLCEPAGAMNVVTVGSLAHGNGLSARAEDNVGVRSITDVLEPSPFSRIGPGVRGAIKPDFVDVGGTLVYDGPTAAVHGGETRAEAGVLSLHYQPVDRLFASRSGTSHATPLVAFKAASILSRFPDGSANLVRALLASSANIPTQTSARLSNFARSAEINVAGHGQVNSEKAAFSDDSRVVLYAEDELAVDHFAVYQIPIPELFQTERGRRTIRVSLAYDPPVRHSRLDYNGVSMGFRLIRGCEPDKIFEHFRQRAQTEGPVPEMENRYNCDLKPGPTLREKSSLQTAKVEFSRDISAYGDSYFLVVRCAGGWAGDVGQQSFAVAVEISHEAELALYERLRQRVRVRA